MKRLLIMLAIAAAAWAQQTETLTAVPPLGVNGLGAGTIGTAGTATACYWVVVNYVGGGVLSAAPACPTNVPNTLSSSNYVQLTWQAAVGAVTYDVLKTTTNAVPAPGASVSLSTGLTVATANDQGGGLSAYTITNFTYPTSSGILSLNNRDYSPPAFDFSGSSANPIQSAFGIIVPKVNAAGVAQTIRLGSRTTPFTIDNTGAPFLTSGSAAPGSALGTVTAGVVVSTSANLTTAQVNAGTTIVPAVTGQTYKLQHVILKAKGGDTAGCTLVEVADTAGTPIVGMSVAIAQLTNGALVTETSGTGVTVTTLAPTALTAAKGIQVLKTGASCTTATSFDVIVFYTINS